MQTNITRRAAIARVAALAGTAALPTAAASEPLENPELLSAWEQYRDAHELNFTLSCEEDELHGAILGARWEGRVKDAPDHPEYENWLRAQARAERQADVMDNARAMLLAVPAYTGQGLMMKMAAACYWSDLDTIDQGVSADGDAGKRIWEAVGPDLHRLANS